MMLLGLDVSSVAIGWCLFDGESVRAFGTAKITCLGDAYAFGAAYCDARPQVAIESPVLRFPKATIPQIRASGAVLAGLGATEWVELTPTEGKLALAGKGGASKPDMVAAAQRWLAPGQPVQIGRHRGKYGAWDASTPMLTLPPAKWLQPLYNEDAADALGVALAAWGKR